MSSDQGEMFEVTQGQRPGAMSRQAAPDPSPESYGVPFQRHSDTSKAAAVALKDSKALRALVYKAITASGERGMTDPEAQAHLGLKGSTQRPRRVRLVELGLVRDSGKRRASQAGRPCTVWVAT